VETQTNPLHLCPEINVIRCMLNFDKHDKVSHKSKCKAPPLTLGLPFARLGLGLPFFDSLRHFMTFFGHISDQE